MASQTKVAPVEQTSAMAAPTAASEGGGGVMRRGGDDMEDDEPADSAMASTELVSDDEDVSLDELLISDGADDDDEDDARTEVHEGLHRVAMQELNAMQSEASSAASVSDMEGPSLAFDAEIEAPSKVFDAEIEASSEAFDSDIEASSVAFDSDEAPESATAEVEGLEPTRVESEASQIEAVAPGMAGEALELAPPPSDEPAAPALEPSEPDEAPSLRTPSLQVLSEELDGSPEAAAARAAADQEAVAVAVERARSEPSDPDVPISVSAESLELDEEAARSEPMPDTLENRRSAGDEITPPPLSADDKRGDVDLESLRSDVSQGPLPSFDIPDLESGMNGRRLSLEPDAPSSLADTHSVAQLSPLSEAAEEDDEDAVTHIGLPVHESGAEYPAVAEPRFEAAEPAVAALASFDPSLIPVDARRAATRVIPRIDPSQLPPGGAGRGFDPAERRADTMRPLSGAARPAAALGAWFKRFLKQPSAVPSALGSAEPTAENRRIGWLVDNVLPPLSFILLGSGIGAGIMLLQQESGPKNPAQRVQALQEEKRPTTLLERAEAGDGEALFKITNMAPGDRTSALTLALEAGYRAQKLNEFHEFRNGMQAPPSDIGPALAARLIAYATSPETMLPTFELLSEWTGSRGPDVMYAIWEKAPGGAGGSSRAAQQLAQQLLRSADQRAKATAALNTAVDLRAASSCDDYLAVLPAVVRSGDQRCSSTLRSLKHTDGCGDNGQQDCYACLRDGTQLDEALAAVEKRPAPSL